MKSSETISQPDVYLIDIAERSAGSYRQIWQPHFASLPKIRADSSHRNTSNTCLLSILLLLILLRFPAAPLAAQVPAFPGAKGAGASSVGGRGGKIIEVTNLNAKGPGSFRAACAASGARIVIFKVSGTIDLGGTLNITHPYLTIAGQTAPGEGVQIKNSDIRIYTHDVVIRYVRIRPGSGGPVSSHCIFIGDAAYNIIVDHCSLQWARDENFTVYSGDIPGASITDITSSWNLISEGIARGFPPQHDQHAAGMIVGSVADADKVERISIHHNIISNNEFRNPYLKCKSAQFVNNIVYNWAWWGMLVEGGATLDLIGNLFKQGSAFVGDKVYFYTDWAISWNVMAGDNGNLGAPGDPSIYVTGNKDVNNWTDAAGDNWGIIHAVNEGNNWHIVGSVKRAFERLVPQSNTHPISVTSVSGLETSLLPYVGAYRRLNADSTWTVNRDSVDTRLIQEYKNGTGALLYDEDDVGGYPSYAPATGYTDTDHDGMPDTWEITYGLNPNSAADSSGDADGDGYTNVEEFLNGTSPVSASELNPPARLKIIGASASTNNVTKN